MTLLDCTLLTDDGALAALQPEWRGLHARARDATPFQSPDWLLPWWKQFGTGHPRIATLHVGERLAGVLPLYRLDQGASRRLLPMGCGLSDYCGALLERGLPDSAASTLLAAAVSGDAAGQITGCDLTDVAPGNALCTAGPPCGWTLSREPGEVCPVLELARDPPLPPPASAGGETAQSSPLPHCGRGRGWGPPEDILPAGIRRKIRMSTHRAERRGGIAVETATPATAGSLLEHLIRLHTQRWEGRGKPGVLAEKRVTAFHRHAAPGLVASGLARLQALRIGGELAAVFYFLLGPDAVFAYLGGFDPAFAHESPGTLLFAAAIGDALRDGRREFHFLRGGESYKYAWGARDRRNVSLRLIPA